MKQSILAALRRARDPAFVQRYFSGTGIDISDVHSRMHAHAYLFPRIGQLLWWDTAQGGMSLMHTIGDESLDFVLSNGCLAREENPAQTLARWLDLLKPGGVAVVTVPDADLYEKGAWPSRFAPAHRHRFTMCRHADASPDCVDVFDLVRTLSVVASCERVNLVSDHYDPARADEDQTAHGIAECVIEIVLKKRALPSAGQLIDAITAANSADDALRLSRYALDAYPYRPDLYHRALTVMLRWKLFDEADAITERSMERLGNMHVLRLTNALHHIARGRLQDGFTRREAMMRSFGWQRRTKAEPPANTPIWTGEPLAGKSIVIWSEFGLGDEIFFFRFARILRERCGARAVSVVCQMPLVELFEASGEADAVIGIDHVKDLPAHDFWVFPHAIPAYLPLDLDALPASVPYLRATPRKLDAPASALKVGFAFKGDPTHENDAERSAPSLSVFDAWFALEGIEFYSVQKGAGADETAAYAARLPNFHDLGANLHSMADTASTLAAMDVVVAVDTSIVHLAGALGKPVWLMLPFYGDWRWHQAREDSPWFPSMRLFRREWGHGWEQIVARIGGELKRLCDERISR